MKIIISLSFTLLSLFTVAQAPIANFQTSASLVCVGDTVLVQQTSFGNPTSFSWTISPPHYTLLGSNTLDSPYVWLRIDSLATFDVKLRASNNFGADSLTRTAAFRSDTSVSPSLHISTYDTLGCEGRRLTFTSSAVGGGDNPAYLWYVNDTLKSWSFQNRYYLNGARHNDTVVCKMISSLSCATDTAISNTWVVQAIPLPNVQITNSLRIGSYCKEDTILLSGSVNSFGYPYVSHWTGNGVSGGKFIPALAGSGFHTIYFGAALVNSHGCSSFDTLRIPVDILPKPTVSIVQAGVLRCDQNFGGYQWVKDGQGIPGANQRTLNLSGPGKYYVQVTSANSGSCHGRSDEINITDIGLDEKAMAALDLAVYPNPAKGRVQVVVQNLLSAESHLELRQADGRLLNSQEIRSNGEYRAWIDMNDYPAGLYYFCLRTGNERLTRKFTKH